MAGQDVTRGIVVRKEVEEKGERGKERMLEGGREGEGRGLRCSHFLPFMLSTDVAPQRGIG